MASLIRSQFRAFVLVLAVGVCVVVAKLADSTPSDDQPPSPTIKHIPPAAVNKAEPPSPPSTEAGAVESAPSPEADPLPASESGDAVSTQLPLKLVGTMASADPGMSLAIVYEDTTQHSRTVWTGSTLQGAKVLAIGRTRLWLSNKGRVEFLEIAPGSADPKGAAEPSSSADPTASPTAAPRAFGVSLQQTGPDTYVVQRSDVNDIRAHQKELVEGGERKGEFRNGYWTGIKVVSVVPGSIYERMGLKPGDVLLKANGWLLGFPPQEIQAVGLLKTATRIELEIERDGQNIRKTYLLQD